MIALSNGLALFGDPVLLVGVIAITFALLELERVWTRSRRRRGFDPGAAAYLLDGLVLAGVVLALGGLSTLFIGGLASIGYLLGGVFDGGRVGTLIVGAALAIGLVLVLARMARGRRAAHDVGSASAGVPPADLSTSPAAVLSTTPLTAPAYQPAPAPVPAEPFDEEPVPSLSMLQGQWQPAARPAATGPTSFLELAQPQSVGSARSRFGVASSLLALAIVALLVGGAILFRGPLIGLLAGLDGAGEPVAVAGNAAGTVQPVVPTEQPAANISSADQPPAPASEAPQAGTRRVKSDELNVRARPGVGQQVVMVLTKGVSVAVLTDARLINDTIWVKVRVGDQEGWVDQSLLE